MLYFRRDAPSTEFLLHRGFRTGCILQCMGNDLIAKQLVHLLEGLSFGLRKEEDVAYCSDQVPHEKEVEELKSYLRKCDGSTLSEDEVQRPVGEG